MTETTIAAMTSTGKDDWETPHWLFDKLNAEFHFTLDPCCTHQTAKCRKHYTPAENGLIQDWGGGDCFLQSSLLPQDQHKPRPNRMGAEMRGRGAKAQHNCCGAAARANGHGAFSFLYLRQSGDPLSQGPRVIS